MFLKSVVCLTAVVFVSVSCTPVQNTEQRTKRSEKIQDLQSKLSRLRDLLKDIDENDLQNKETKPSTQLPSTTKGSHEKSAVDTRGASESDMHSESQLEDSLKASSLSAGLDALDTNTLKALMEALNTLKSKRLKQKDSARKIGQGRFFDQPFKESDLDRQNGNQREDKLKQLAAELLTKTQHGQEDYDMYDLGQAPLEDIEHLYPRPDPMEDNFGSFKSDVLQEVEGSLLNDVDVALRNGLTLEDLLRDITKKENQVQYKQLRLLQDAVRRRNQQRLRNINHNRK